MNRYLTILEVSQKQAYIFASNKLRENIVNSEVIAHVLSPEYIEKTLKGQGYSNEQNMVYSGGGHTVLQFESDEKPTDGKAIPECIRKPISILTEKIYRDFDGLEVFVKTLKYDEGKNPKDNLKELTAELEKKKSIRLSAFRQGSYGVEKVDSSTLDIVPLEPKSEDKEKLESLELSREQGFYPHGYKAVTAFEELGGSKNDKNFIAVVHIDGNGMGKRVEELYGKLGNDWENVRAKLKQFSDCIDVDFKDALKETADELGSVLLDGSLSDLSLRIEKDGAVKFPLRRVITAGDDICFVTEGRIGIECAAIFIRKLANKKNKVDEKGYCASAGVALVHQKYPFYRAYELAEMLCSSAKKFGAAVNPDDNGREIGAIDWHIEYGEIQDSLEEIRRQYATNDGNRMEMRPYIVVAPEDVTNRANLSEKLYGNFKMRLMKLQRDSDNYPMGKIKEMRTVIRAGEKETEKYLKLNRMNSLAADMSVTVDTDMSKVFSGKADEKKIFIEQIDGKKHASLFDAIELIDVYLPVGKEA